VQPRPASQIADSLGSRREGTVRRLSRDHLAVGIVLLIVGVLAFRISPWLAWFAIALGILALSWHARMQRSYRGLLYFLALLPVLHWFNSLNEFFFHEDVVSGMMLSGENAPWLEWLYGLLFATAAVAGLIVVIRRWPAGSSGRAAVGRSEGSSTGQPRWSNVPARTFADVGGLDDQKKRISAIRAEPAASG
jgi:hypothetical protein